MPKSYVNILSIAGSDSGGCAGIQADIKTACHFNCFASTVITAITAQNTKGVQAISEVPKDVIAAQLKSVLTDINIDAIKIGLIPSSNALHIITSILYDYKNIPIVIDPVLIASSGDNLTSEVIKPEDYTPLFNLATLITPNEQEAKILFKKANTSTPLLITGGESSAKDTLIIDDEHTYYESKCIQSKNTHGTGCSFSTAIACGLARGHTVKEAVQSAKGFIFQAIEKGKSYHYGEGHGPIYFFA